MKLRIGKKGVTFSQLSSVGLLFVLVGITLGIGAYVMLFFACLGVSMRNITP